MDTLGLNAKPKVVLRLRLSLTMTTENKGISTYDGLGKYDDKHRSVKELRNHKILRVGDAQ